MNFSRCGTLILIVRVRESLLGGGALLAAPDVPGIGGPGGSVPLLRSSSAVTEEKVNNYQSQTSFHR